MAKKTQEALPKVSEFWRYKELGRDPHELVNPLIQSIQKDQSSRYEAYKHYYQACEQDVTAWGEDRDLSIYWDGEDKQNELVSTIETLHAQVFKNKVIPQSATDGGSWQEFRRAQLCSRFLSGVFSDAKVHKDAVPQAGMDTLICGTGFIRIGSQVEGDRARITSYSVSPLYVYVDRFASRHGKPRTLSMKWHYDRYQLLSMYGGEGEDLYGSKQDREAKIREAKSNDDPDYNVADSSKGDMITVWETWHLPSSPGAEDGLYVVTISNCTLLVRKWTRPRFPLGRMKFGIPTGGFYGISAVKRLLPMQKNLDHKNSVIKKSEDLLGVPRIVVRKGNESWSTAELDNEVARIIEVDDPNGFREWNAQPCSPEMYRSRDSIPDRMRGVIGVSMFEAQGNLPPHMRDVGQPFLDRFVDQGPARHAMIHAQYEQCMEELGEIILDEAEELQELGYEVVSAAPSGKRDTVEFISFKDVGVDRKKIRLLVQSMSQLPQTFAGKVEALDKLRQNGDVSRSTYRRLLDNPDIEAENDRDVSDEDIILKTLDYMVQHKKYLPPLPTDNLALVVRTTIRYINQLRVRQDPEDEEADDIVAMLLKYVEDAKALPELNSGTGIQNSPLVPPPPPAMPPGMPPPGGPPGIGLGPGMPPGPQPVPPGMGP